MTKHLVGKKAHVSK
ncbi:Protein of unknown function [Bacillus mycoides]|uniref:Uncharacterized protein n=1 Tax=Bacillus mycoides TaxID=1405 RepID=A0A1D3MP33_BACMY|nr:Protein of unknown function [Bacillus mycoides]SCM87715.1 Protein of unknown function [Bacillus mycoides]